MDIALRPEIQKFVESKLRAGDYNSIDEVVENAILRWKADEEIDPAKLKQLVAQGQAEADRGELLNADDVFAEIDERSRRRRGA